MRTVLTMLIAGAAVAASALPALAQNATAAGAADGAAAGSAAGGAIGAVVGGVTGAVLGAPAPVVDPGPTTTRRSTCVTASDGTQRCDSVETTN